jgi:hypothetical protein
LKNVGRAVDAGWKNGPSLEAGGELGALSGRLAVEGGLRCRAQGK